MLPAARFSTYIEQNQLFNTGDRVLAAVSGGMDSVLMVHLLKAAGCSFGIAHCNFQLRGADADADQQFCRQLAHNLGVEFHTINFDTTAYVREHKISVQMAARELRYQWFEQIRKQYNYATVALAHHQNDAIETILLNLIRGTGIAGLHGILPKNNQWVRPLLFLTRDEIASIITQNQLAYVEDSSNASTKYARNKLRHEVIPKLKELNPALEQTFERNLAHFRELELLLQQQVAQARKQLWVEHGKDIHISLQGIQQLYPQRLLLIELLKGYGFNDISVDDLIASLSKHSGRVFESATHLLVLDREKLILTPISNDEALQVSVSEQDEQVIYHGIIVKITHENAGADVQAGKHIAITDAELLIYPLTIRSWQQGDYFIPLGMNGHKKLSDFFVGQKVPLHQKTQIPVLINGNNEVIWIAGYRLDNRYKLTPQTKKVTIFELL